MIEYPNFFAKIQILQIENIIHMFDMIHLYGVFFLCVIRNPVKCGQTVRLLHVSTRRNLHSHHFQSPLSRNLEVSAFGEEGEGDEGKLVTKQKLIPNTCTSMLKKSQD